MLLINAAIIAVVAIVLFQTSDAGVTTSARLRRFHLLRRSGNTFSGQSTTDSGDVDWLAAAKMRRMRVERRQQRNSAIAGGGIDEQRDRSTGRAPRCVNIPDNLTTCRSLLGYRQMRTPNLLKLVTDIGLLSSTGDDVIAEWIEGMLNTTVRVEGSVKSSSSLSTACSASAGVFACSLVSPVCLERPVWPCRSLCHKVRRECDGTVRWPESIDCDWLPTDDRLCIGRESPSANGTAVMVLPRASLTTRTSSTEEEGSTTTIRSVENINVTLNGVVTHSTVDRLSTPGQMFSTRRVEQINDDSLSPRPACIHPDCVRPEAASDIILDNYCSSDFVAKIRPDRYIMSSNEVKIIASKAIKFYKLTTSSSSLSSSAGSSSRSSHRTKWTFHIDRSLFTNCTCDNQQQTVNSAGGIDMPVSMENFVVMGRLERVGGRRRRVSEHDQKQRLEVTVIAPFDMSSREFRHALRAVKDNDNTCGSSIHTQAPLTTSNVPTRRQIVKEAKRDRRYRNRNWPTTAVPQERIIKNERKRLRLVKKMRKASKSNRRLKESDATEKRQVVGSIESDQRAPHVQPDRRQQRRQQKSQRSQLHVDEQTVMANRKDRMEGRKLVRNRTPRLKNSKKRSRREDSSS